MPRGVVPRQPAKTGRQDRSGVVPRTTKPKVSQPHVGAGLRAARNPAAKKAKYNSLAPDRVAEILKRLNQLYPDVTCTLEHHKAWALLGANILSTP